MFASSKGVLLSCLVDDRDHGSLPPLGSPLRCRTRRLGLLRERGGLPSASRSSGQRHPPLRRGKGTEPFRIVEPCNLTNMLRHAHIIRRRISFTRAGGLRQLRAEIFRINLRRARGWRTGRRVRQAELPVGQDPRQLSQLAMSTLATCGHIGWAILTPGSHFAGPHQWRIT